MDNQIYILIKSLQETFFQYVDHAKVNGLWLLRRNQNQDGLKKFAWSFVLFFLLIFGMVLSIMLWNKFYSLPTIVTIDTHVPVTSVAFPGITLCSPLTVLEHKLQAFMDKIINPPNYTKDELTKALRSIEGFTIRHTVNKTRYEIADKILALNNLTVYDTIREIGASCDDFLQYCYWGSKQFPCYQNDDDLTFTTSISHAGSCCSFNYNPENQSYVPFSANNFGVNGGLVIVGLDRIMGNQSTGLIMRVHHSLDYAVESSEVITLNPYSETFVVVYPIQLSSSAEVLELSTKKRNCQIASDFDVTYYRQAGCLLDCQQQLIYQTCGCHSYQYPTIYKRKGIRDCVMKDIECLVVNYDDFRNIKCGNCLPNCNDVTYSTTTDFTDLLQHNISSSVIHSTHNLSEHSFIVRAYLANQVVPSHRKIIIMSVISLLADLGGVFNLCLGISIVSLVELLYFFTLRLRLNYKSKHTLKSLSHAMVVIKECFPSHMDFIAEYLVKRRQQLEILQQRKFKVSFVPREEERATPIEPYDVDKGGNPFKEVDTVNIQTPVIIPVPEEPKYVKNFNAFIEQTHQHLNQVLANNQKISDVHGIVTEIQKPPIHMNFFTTKDTPALISGELASKEVTPKQLGRVTCEFNSSVSDQLELPRKNCHVASSSKIVEKIPLTRTTRPVASSVRAKSAKQELTRTTQRSNKSLSVRSDTRPSIAPSSRKSNSPADGATKYYKEVERTKTRTITTATKPVTSRTVIPPTFSSRNRGNVSRRSNIDTTRSEGSIWKDKKMTPIPISVINLQL